MKKKTTNKTQQEEEPRQQKHNTYNKAQKLSHTLTLHKKRYTTTPDTTIYAEAWTTDYFSIAFKNKQDSNMGVRVNIDELTNILQKYTPHEWQWKIENNDSIIPHITRIHFHKTREREE